MTEQTQKVETEMIVRYAETDQMGIAHHSYYPVWFEAGRTAFFKRIGSSYSQIESNGILLPLTDMSCKFKKPAKYEDTIIIKTYISRLTHVRIGFRYEVLNKETGDLLACGETNHGWTDRQLNPVAIETRLPDLFYVLQKNMKLNHMEGESQ